MVFAQIYGYTDGFFRYLTFSCVVSAIPLFVFVLPLSLIGGNMTDKELRKLTRSELLEMLIIQTERNEMLNAELDEARRQLKNRKIICEKAGTLSEASLQLSGVFKAAEEAAGIYLENLERMSAECDKQKSYILDTARKEADKMIEEAEKYSDDIHKEADEYWNCVYDKAQSLLREHSDLQKLAFSIERK